MKKIWSTDRWRTLTRIRQLAAEREHRLTYQEARRRLLQSRRARARKFKPVWVAAPENFSLVNNTDAVLRFLQSIHEAVDDRQVPTIDLRAVQSIGPDALAALISTVDEICENYQVEVGGNEPSVPAIAQVFRRSGFYAHVRPPKSLRHADRSEDSGLIMRHAQHIVDGPMARMLVEFAFQKVEPSALDSPVKTRQWAMYDAIEEFMQNTFDHAAREVSGKERWWASVQYDESANAAHITFLDNGVGIFGSRQLRAIDRLREYFDLPPSTTLLEEIFAGRLASRTGIEYRGQGLPRIARHVSRGSISNLVVVTNRVKGYLHTGKFVALAHEFPGTLYYWDLVNDHDQPSNR